MKKCNRLVAYYDDGTREVWGAAPVVRHDDGPAETVLSMAREYHDEHSGFKADGSLRVPFPPSTLDKLPDSRLRIELVDFAVAMEMKLKQNDDKGGWSKCNPWWLLSRMHEEARELRQALDAIDFPMDDAKRQAIVDEAVDVANFAMMIADVIWKKS